MSPALQIFLLGSFRLFVEGTAVSSSQWQKRKARLLIQILALQPAHELHREELVEMMFPEMDETAASANFYRILYAARRVLEPNRSSYAAANYLISDGRQIKLAAEALWIDAEEFENKARKGLNSKNREVLESAAELYRGDLLTEAPFEDWTQAPRERLRMLFHTVLRKLSEIEERTGNTEQSHFWLDQILKHEPADEDAHRKKIRLYQMRGEHALALRQYEKCAAVLRRELGVAPDKETDELRDRIFSAKAKKI